MFINIIILITQSLKDNKIFILFHIISCHVVRKNVNYF